jgi:hypothetical protein
MSLPYWDRVKYGQSEHIPPDRNHVLAAAGRHIKVEEEKKVEPHHEWTPYAGPLLWTGK